MANSQEAKSKIHVEIQSLKEELSVSQKKIDRYAHLIAMLFDELEHLHSNICHTCKKKLVPGDASVPDAVPSDGHGSSWTKYSASTSLWHRMFQGHQRQPHVGSLVNDVAVRSSSNSPPTPSPIPKAASLTQDKPLPVPPGPAAAPDEQISSNPESELPVWSVEYNPEVKPTLDLRIAHVFTHESPVYCVKMSPDEQRIAIGLEDDGKTFVNDLKAGSNTQVLMDRYIVKDSISILGVQFSPDGQLLATAASDMRIRIWDIAQRRVRATFKRHTGNIATLAFSPDGRSLISGSNDRTVRIWKIRDGSSRELIDNANHFISVAVSPDGRYIATSNFDRLLRIWDSRTHKLVARWKEYPATVWCVQFTPDGKGLMTGCSDGTLKHWDVGSLGIHKERSRKEVANLERGLTELRCFQGHTGCVRSIAFPPGNGRWVVTSAEDRTVRLWDSQTGVWQFTLLGHSDWVREVDFREHFLATGSKDRRVTLWRYDVL